MSRLRPRRRALWRGASSFLRSFCRLPRSQNNGNDPPSRRVCPGPPRTSHLTSPLPCLRLFSGSGLQTAELDDADSWERLINADPLASLRKTSHWYGPGKRRRGPPPHHHSARPPSPGERQLFRGIEAGVVLSVVLRELVYSTGLIRCRGFCPIAA